jgi:hypothetical protein
MILTIYGRDAERMIAVAMAGQFEEPVMNARFVLSSAALMSASAFAAEPPKAPVQPATQQQPGPAQVVLASADNHASTPDSQSGTATKRPRVARVTTCRCGGQEADPPAQPEQ